MLYREVGQFKTSYAADQAIFPILQDRWFVGLVIAAAFLVVPLSANQYLYTEVLIPVLILSLAAITASSALDLLRFWPGSSAQKEADARLHPADQTEHKKGQRCQVRPVP